MTGLQVVAGLVLLCLIAVLFLPPSRAVRSNHLRKPLPPDVFHYIQKMLPDGWTIVNTPLGASIYGDGCQWLYVYVRFSTLGGGDYPEMRIVLERDGRMIASTWLLSPAAETIITGHIIAAIKRETQHHDDTH